MPDPPGTHPLSRHSIQAAPPTAVYPRTRPNPSRPYFSIDSNGRPIALHPAPMRQRTTRESRNNDANASLPTIHYQHQKQIQSSKDKDSVTSTTGILASKLKPSQVVLEMRKSFVPSPSSPLSSSTIQDIGITHAATGTLQNAATKTSSVSGRPLKSGIIRPSTSYTPQGSTISSSRWIQGVPVKDAASQTVEPFIPAQYATVDWAFLSTPRQQNFAPIQANQNQYPANVSDVDTEEEEILSELRQLENRRGTALGRDCVSTGMLENALFYGTRCVAPDADQLAASAISASTSSLQQEIPESPDFKYATLDTYSAGKDYIANAVADGCILKPVAVRPTACYDHSGTNLSSLLRTPSGESVVMPLGPLKARRTNSVASSSDQSSSSTLGGGYGYPYSKVDLHSKYMPQTPISSVQSAYSEDESSSIASSSHRTLPNSIGSPDSSKVAYMGADISGRLYNGKSGVMMKGKWSRGAFVGGINLSTLLNGKA